MAERARRGAKRTTGERAGLSRAAVLDGALALADRDGLGALSMRRLADALDVEAMTLYHYVPSKEALLDGMIERVFTQAAPPLAADGEAWATVLRRYAVALRETLLAHPGILPVVLSRPAATAETFQAVEGALGLLVRAGFELGAALNALNVLTVFVTGHAVAEASIGNGGADDAGSAAALALLDETEYPLLAQAARSGQGTDDAERFAFGLDAFLAGLNVSLNGVTQELEELDRGRA
jgi:AcrR family transcriptional regulator